MRQSKQIVLASTNRKKYTEFRTLLKTYPGLDLLPANEIIRNADKLGQVETFNTYLENASAKARAANLACHYPVLADDSGIEIDGLDGKPGVRSARFAIPKAGTTQDQANVDKVLKELNGMTGAKRNARFVCVLALVIEGIVLTATETLEGRISEKPQGENGFGYDPIFIPQGSDRTLAELGEEVKNTISHRSKAFHELMSQVKARGIVFARP